MSGDVTFPYKQHTNVLEYVTELDAYAKANPMADMRRVITAHCDETLKILVGKKADTLPQWAPVLVDVLVGYKENVGEDSPRKEPVTDKELRSEIKNMAKLATKLEYPKEAVLNTKESDPLALVNSFKSNIKGDKVSKDEFFAEGEIKTREQYIRRSIAVGATVESVVTIFDQEQRGLIRPAIAVTQAQVSDLSPEAKAQVEAIRQQTQNPQPAVPASVEETSVGKVATAATR